MVGTVRYTGILNLKKLHTQSDALLNLDDELTCFNSNTTETCGYEGTVSLVFL